MSRIGRVGRRGMRGADAHLLELGQRMSANLLNGSSHLYPVERQRERERERRGEEEERRGGGRREGEIIGCKKG